MRKKGKPRKLRKTDVELANSKAKGFDNVKAPPPVRREPTFLDKLVLKQPPPADVATAEQYDGASFIRQSTPVALPKATSRKAVVKPRSRGAGARSAKASIAKCIAKAKVRREQREAEAAAAGKADEPATAGEAAEAGEADEVQIVGECSWAEKDAERFERWRLTLRIEAQYAIGRPAIC